ncbi:Cyclic nucleotide-gated cation channel alpha-3 [Acropora cervicornis]|uniref:Cyclic nucleotide-gated cation channel alpha-3 n=1 Tax=Acropora cervicornis TaxID=6130 RepID=A0AAD9QGL4_ACRCE|nr:Cyclic nucleotide-gated cation channel alpha-3 [Acropora cervicornis]
MGLVAAIVLYNFWTVILRIAFSEMREESLFRFLFWWGDSLADVLYACDLCVQLHTAYRDDHGIMVKDPVKLKEKYTKSRRCKVDIICLLPSEAISYLIPFPCHVKLLRLFRLLKYHSVDLFFVMSDYRTSKPYRLRAFKLILYLSVAMHWVACLYYTISEYEGLGTNDWVYTETKTGGDHFARKYIKSFYWSVLTLMTIGETPSPQTNVEYIFTGCMFLLGIFVFATVVGNVGDVISNMNAARTNFQSRMDSIKQFMEQHEVPDTLQTRVKRWAHYAWSRNQAFDEGSSLEMLPERLRAEIAIHVHLDTLRKVKIFKDCEQGLLCELVLKLRPQIFSPGDYICRSGEIGRDMYIINNGKVEVVILDASTSEEVVVASLSEGNYFGEISLLRLDGGKNRRSADVRSVGYSELLCLSQKDLMEALEEYPDAKKVLENQGRDRLQRTRLESNLLVPLPSETNQEKLHEIEFNFAREVKEIRHLLEEMKESKKEVNLGFKRRHSKVKIISHFRAHWLSSILSHYTSVRFLSNRPDRSKWCLSDLVGGVKLSGNQDSLKYLREECFYLRGQVEKQMEELNRIKRQLQHMHAQRNSPNDLKRRNNTNAGTQSGKRLIQRVLFAAKLASECSVTCHGKHPIHGEKSPCKKSECMRSVVQDVVPEIYVDSDVDGVCYICGPRRKSLNNGSD